MNALAGRIAAASAGRHVLAVSDGRAGLTGVELAEAAAEFETYLKLAPDGPNAKEAQTNFDALKGFIKK